MRRLKVTPGFLLLAALLFYLDEGVDFLPWCILAAALHELGHYTAGRLLGGRACWLELSAVGAQLSMTYPGPLSYCKTAVVLLSGPAANLILGVAAAKAGQFILAGVSFGMGVFNLVPVYPLDGGQALYACLASLLDEDAAEWALSVIAGVVTGILAGGGAVAAVYFGNFSLMITTLWLLCVTLQKNR